MVFNILKGPRPTDANKLERFLGHEACENMSKGMENWYGPPISVAGVPGNVWVNKGGDFFGKIRDGYETTALDMVWDFGRRLERGFRHATRANRAQFGAGFASLSDLIAEATGGKRQDLTFSKTSSVGVASATSSLWRLGSSPAAGVPPTTLNGTAVTVANTGAIPFVNASSYSGSDTLHIVGAAPASNQAGSTLLLYDRLFHCVKTNSITTTEAVTGVPTRYQNTTVATAQDYVAGNFIFPEVGATLNSANGVGNWTVCQYTNQSGTASQSIPSIAGAGASAPIDRINLAVGNWFMPLAAGDTGIMKVTQLQCSANNTTGNNYMVIGHPLAWMPCPIANMTCQLDGINSAFNLTRIFDGAALAFLDYMRPSTASTIFTGSITVVAG